jgi:acyl homoserine lactone synthase
LWHFEKGAAARVADRAGVPLERSRQWFDHAFGRPTLAQFSRSA